MTLNATPDADFSERLPRRDAARLLLVDCAGRVLLLRHDPPLHVFHWAGPGGGMQAGESPEEALERELSEELALTSNLVLRRVGSWRHVFAYRGTAVVQHESLFGATLPSNIDPDAVKIGHQARQDGIFALRWWWPDELEQTREEIWPAGLSDWLSRTP